MQDEFLMTSLRSDLLLYCFYTSTTNNWSNVCVQLHGFSTISIPFISLAYVPAFVRAIKQTRNSLLFTGQFTSFCIDRCALGLNWRGMFMRTAHCNSLCGQIGRGNCSKAGIDQSPAWIDYEGCHIICSFKDHQLHVVTFHRWQFFHLLLPIRVRVLLPALYFQNEAFLLSD